MVSDDFGKLQFEDTFSERRFRRIVNLAKVINLELYTYFHKRVALYYHFNYTYLPNTRSTLFDR